jgi:hypothetical protein
MFGKPRRIVTGIDLATFTVNAASGTYYADWPNLASFRARGVVVGVQGRLHTGGGWTVSSLRIKIADLKFTTAVTAATVADEHLCFDSDTIATPAASSTVCFLDELFGATPQPYTDGIRLLCDWTTSAGAGTSTITLAAYLLEDL